MAGLPYPVNNVGIPYPDPNPSPYGQPAQGDLPYPISSTSDLFPCPTLPNSSQQSYTSEPNVSCFMLPYPSDTIPQGVNAGSVPYPCLDHGQVDPSIAYPSQLPYPSQQQNTPYPPPAFPGEPSHEINSSPYPSGEYEGKDSMETVEYNEGLRKSVFSRSGLLGKAINKGISLA